MKYLLAFIALLLTPITAFSHPGHSHENLFSHLFYHPEVGFLAIIILSFICWPLFKKYFYSK